MAVKDIEGKMLEDFNDVFADIVNVNLFNGKRIVKQTDLENIKDKSRFKSTAGVITEQERDVAKWWKSLKIRIALIGIENQTDIDENMCFRLYGYDGAAYKSQYNEKEKYPVITMVLYFGTTHWKTGKKLSDNLNIPEQLKDYFNDYKMNLIEVAWQTEEQLSMYKSDFKFVADYFIQKRKNKQYTPSSSTIKHVDSVLKMMSALTGDDRFEQIINERVKGERRPRNMCEILDKIEEKGRKEGRKEGRQEGRKEGRKEGRQQGILEILSGLVNDGLLSITEAAKRAGMSVPKFKKEIGSIKNKPLV